MSDHKPDDPTGGSDSAAQEQPKQEPLKKGGDLDYGLGPGKDKKYPFAKAKVVDLAREAKVYLGKVKVVDRSHMPEGGIVKKVSHDGAVCVTGHTSSPRKDQAVVTTEDQNPKTKEQVAVASPSLTDVLSLCEELFKSDKVPLLSSEECKAQNQRHRADSKMLRELAEAKFGKRR